MQEFDADGWHTVAMPIVTHAGQRPSWLVVTSQRKAFVNQLTRPAAQATVPLLAAMARLGGVARDQERAIRGSLLEDVLKGRAATRRRRGRWPHARPRSVSPSRNLDG